MNLVSGVDLTDDFHVLRVAQPPGVNLFYTWFDGTLLETFLTGDSQPDGTYFGGNERNMEGLVQVDYVRWTGDGGFECPTCESPAALVPEWQSNSAGAAWDDPDNYIGSDRSEDNTRRNAECLQPVPS